VKVIDASDKTPVAGAEVVVLEAGGKARLTDAQGRVLLDPADPMPYSFRVQAAGHVSLPLAGEPLLRAVAVHQQTVTATVVLDPMPGAMPGGTLTGTVTKDGAPSAGVLVVASAVTSFSALTDANGSYRLLGVAPGLYQVRGYFGGYTSNTAMNVEVKVGMTAKKTDLNLTPAAGVDVGGMLGAGTASTAATTTVALAEAGSGAWVPGLSAIASFGGHWSVSGVQPGSYLARAALERDGWVVDPELIKKGKTLAISVGTSSVTLDIPIAPAVAGLSPTLSSTAASPPVLSWSTFPGADFYVVELRDIGGQVLLGGFGSHREPNKEVLAPLTSLTLDPSQPLLQPLGAGRLYQFRIYAAKNVTTGELFQLIGASEERDGRFRAGR
jgi:hypothetical protein